MRHRSPGRRGGEGRAFLNERKPIKPIHPDGNGMKKTKGDVIDREKKEENTKKSIREGKERGKKREENFAKEGQGSKTSQLQRAQANRDKKKGAKGNSLVSRREGRRKTRSRTKRRVFAN